jgi:GNAT superfamily N-acetyltransferase
MQDEFYFDVICNPNSPHRYWTLEDETIEGMGGITNIQWENRIGEISLLIRPASRGQGYGEKAVELLLDQAFNYLNLFTVCGECYNCNPNVTFWLKIIDKYNGYKTTLLDRKFWDGKFYQSIYFSMDAVNFNNEYRKVHPPIQSS